MIALALEASSAEGSVAAWNGGRHAFAAWPAERGRAGGGALGAARGALERVGCPLEEVELFVAGRGPGRSGGLRVALAAARFLALPRKREAVAADSGAAIAEAVFEEEPGVGSIVVAGDARGGRIWMGRFERGDPLRRPLGGWRLVDPGSFPGGPAADRIATPEWDRMEPLLRGRPGNESLPWIRENRPPRADALLRLAVRRRERNAAPDPFEPLYLHPAVRR